MSTTGEYFVGTTIGQGGFANVVYGKHKGTDREVAIKVIEQITVKRRPDVLQMVLTERKVLQELGDSTFVVNLWASFYDTECLYLVMELASGGDLYSFIKSGLCSNNKENRGKWNQSIPYYCEQLVQAIKYIHSKGIIHCDLKPQNILLCKRHGRIKLADFANCITLGREFPAMIVPRGTCEYSSPELIKSERNLSVGVDLWSLGCIFYAMFGGGGRERGESPFHAQSDSLSVQLIMNYKTMTDNDSISFLFTNTTTTENDFSSDEWKHRITGLLDANNPSNRVRVWDELLGYKWKKPTCTSALLLPEAPWQQDVDSFEMRDGALGWTAFVL